MKTQLIFLAGSTIAMFIVLTARQASAGAQGGALVRLQATSPGVSQVGHANLNGTVIASQFQGGGSGLFGVNADTLDGIDSTQFLQTVPNPLSLTGSVAGGGVITVVNTSGQSISTGVHSTGMYGVRGIGAHTGLYGEGQNTGVYGEGDVYGGFFRFFSTAGSSGVGVYGLATTTNAGTMIGVKGESNSLQGIGVKGIGNRGTGAIYGVFGTTQSTAGTGVFGDAPSAIGNTVGVWGRVGSTTGYGVFGDGGPNIGVVGIGDNYGVYSFGSSGASGTKSFRIDHPLDPENKWLLHYCSEGPEPLNVYSGTVTTDGKGFADVQLPDYFVEVNRDPRVQLTVVDTANSDSFVLAKVIEKPDQSRFRIRTSEPSVEVYWRVEAVRNDRWVRKNGAPVEPSKAEGERGKYQHPELYGLPAEMAIRQ